MKQIQREGLSCRINVTSFMNVRTYVGAHTDDGASRRRDQRRFSFFFSPLVKLLIREIKEAGSDLRGSAESESWNMQTETSCRGPSICRFVFHRGSFFIYHQSCSRGEGRGRWGGGVAAVSIRPHVTWWKTQGKHKVTDTQHRSVLKREKHTDGHRKNQV